LLLESFIEENVKLEKSNLTSERRALRLGWKRLERELVKSQESKSETSKK